MDLKQLFADYNPPLGDDREFMARLQRNIQAAEAVRQQQREEAMALVEKERTAMRRRSRRSVGIAAVVGFAVGTAFSLAIPHIGQSLAAMLSPMMAGLSVPEAAVDGCRLLAWLLVGAASVAAAISAYDLSLAFAGSRRQR